mmetsp:Transcript_90446/g.260599  ORF Transcript_90446/g.260599 Transcript_90446/m.260599 type:complete len:357 (-) Transcript_90446:43-1113(-)
MNAFLKVDESVRAALFSTDAKARAVKVSVDSKAEALVVGHVVPAGPSLAEDFAKIPGALEDGVPCLVLVRLGDEAGSVPSATDSDWAMVAWTPSGSPVKLRMLCASSRKTLSDACEGLRIKEYPVSERDEVSFERFREATRPSTEEDRRAAMSREEVDAMEVREQCKAEQRAAPKMLAGLVALQIQADASFDEGLATVVKGPGCALLGRLAGPGGENLGGEVLESVATPMDLRGRLPTDAPCYVIMSSSDQRLLMMSWLPDGAPAKLRMKCSTFKASVVQLVRSAAGESPVAVAEITDEDDLAEELFARASSSPPAPAPGAKARGGFKPPVGGFALPGMGPRPPPGGVALPGMGPK